MIKGIIIGCFCFLLFLSHIFIFHHFKVKRRFYLMLKIFLYITLVYAILFAIFPEGQMQKLIKFFMPISLFGFFSGAFLHFSLCYVYLYVVQVIDRSPATRIMVEIESSPEKRLTLDQIKKLYSIDEKIYGELEDMVILDRLNKKANSYIITPKGKMHVMVFKFIRDYLKGRRS